MSAEVRAAMGKAATEAARAVGYVGAGTVEFIADGREGLRADRFYFMEMNTRLQVEHPVTEAITGLDLVELQLKVAAGEPLGFTQSDVQANGHAVEARLYAEDPEKGFLPSTGKLWALQFTEGEGIRIDTGVEAGDTVTPFYDPMIAKVIAHGADRNEALDRLAQVGLVDDEDFAEQWVRSRRTSAGKGKRALAAELRTKGLDNEVITAALADIDAGAERVRAEQLVRDKLRREKLGDLSDRDTENKVTRRLVGMLARRGYSQSMALDVVTTELANERERRKV